MTHISNFVKNHPYRDWGPTANQSGKVIKMWYTNIYSCIIKPYNRIEHSTGYIISAIDSERGY